MKKGFTLVELSIVLVIIGLLIGGILVAQSMISTSKIAAQVAQLGQFDAGVENFRTKYNAIPGDAKQFGGDGDGGIDEPNSGNQNAIFNSEIANFWYNIMPDQYVYTSPSVTVTAVTSGATKNSPLSKMGKSGSFVIASCLSGDNGFSCNGISPFQNYYAILDSTQGQSAVSNHLVFSAATNSATIPAELLALDTKMDDGIANSGNVISGSTAYSFAHNGYGGIVSGPQAYNNPGICSSGAGYLLTHSGYECTPVIRIGSISGDLQ